MLEGKRVFAVIPARSGSKRLPMKNILPLAGKPTIAWTIAASLQSEYIDRVVVSTDDVNLKNVALEWGAEAPFLRPKELSSDTASTDDVLLHAINELALESDDIVILLQPTSPLRTALDIDNSLRLLEGKDVSGVVSVCECEHSPLWSNTLPVDRKMGNFLDSKHSKARSQDLPTHFRLNGAIYAYRVAFLKKYKYRHYSDEIVASIMSQECSIDIDTKLDFDFARFLLEGVE
ncbi:acylneuraminate cytidylyltransferase family protein [Vibrio sp. Isolate25]|uniref:acylneuraminate cytidylyltransferase family protein n=1 Tax=Vibrio sp. Isolate25 TaxID=2908535 RepID=UPI001EFCEDB2|nr:acylneuraminate cytidylyltransferase family protein [Vibrio sp. Isolate25]